MFGIVKIWQWRVPVTNGLTRILDVSDDLLSTAEDGLTVVDNILDNAGTSLTTLENTTDAIVKSMEDTTKLAENFSAFFKNDLISTIKNTQISIIAAKSSAKVIDTLLYGLSNIPFLGIEYKPPEPLNESLSGVANSMDGLPSSFKEISTNLDTSSENITSLQGQVGLISSSLSDIRRNLNDARSVVQDYQTKIDDMQSWSQKIRARLKATILILTIVMTLFLVALAVAQLGAISMSLETIQWRKKETLEVEVAPDRPVT